MELSYDEKLLLKGLIGDKYGDGVKYKNKSCGYYTWFTDILPYNELESRFGKLEKKGLGKLICADGKFFEFFLNSYGQCYPQGELTLTEEDLRKLKKAFLSLIVQIEKYYVVGMYDEFIRSEMSVWCSINLPHWGSLIIWHLWGIYCQTKNSFILYCVNLCGFFFEPIFRSNGYSFRSNGYSFRSNGYSFRSNGYSYRALHDDYAKLLDEFLDDWAEKDEKIKELKGEKRLRELDRKTLCEICTTERFEDMVIINLKEIGANIDEYIKLEGKKENIVNTVKSKKPKIFICHSTKDEKYAEVVVRDFLNRIGIIGEDEIFCSSLPEYGVGVGEDIFETIGAQFENYNLFVIFLVSENYYKSHICQNEAGATRITKKSSNYVVFCLPGFGFSCFEKEKSVLSANNIVVDFNNENAIRAHLEDSGKKLIGFFNEHDDNNKGNNVSWANLIEKFFERMREVSGKIAEVSV